MGGGGLGGLRKHTELFAAPTHNDTALRGPETSPLAFSTALFQLYVHLQEVEQQAAATCEQLVDEMGS